METNEMKSALIEVIQVVDDLVRRVEFLRVLTDDRVDHSLDAQLGIPSQPEDLHARLLSILAKVNKL